MEPQRIDPVTANPGSLGSRETVSSRLLRTKPIDQILADADRPEHRLKKHPAI
jgi:APA family basic amino acid/polyamine antiporter